LAPGVVQGGRGGGAQRAAPSPPRRGTSRDGDRGGAVNIVAATAAPALFGPSFQPPETWAAWGAFLRAAFGLTMSPEELALFRRHTGRSVAPSRPCREA